MQDIIDALRIFKETLNHTRKKYNSHIKMWHYCKYIAAEK